MTAEEFARKLGAKRIGRGKWVARCPAHADSHPSMSIGVGKKSPVVFKCMSSGCSNDEIVSAMGLTWKDVLGDGSGLSWKASLRKLEAERKKQDKQRELLKSRRRMLTARALQYDVLSGRLFAEAASALGKQGDAIAARAHRALDEMRKLDAEIATVRL